MTRSSKVQAALAAALALMLVACGKATSPAPAESSAAAPDVKPGLSLSGGKLVLPAVSGNPGAAYFSITNGSDQTATIAAVDVAGAGMAMLHETKMQDGHSTMGELSSPDVKPGETVTFAPGGKHVMVDAVPATAKPGATIEITITFADGDKLSAPLAVEPPGGAN